MLIETLSSPAQIRTEIDASFTLLQALDKALPSDATLTSDERFEIAALKFIVARALCLNKHASSS